MTARAQTTLQVFLFTDIVGSTQLKARVGDVEGARIIAEHDRCFRECADRFGGFEQNNPGDGFFATFPVPSAALRCALAFQAALATQEVKARVGIHMGEAVHVPGADQTAKLLGLAVDTAGRVMSLALPNQILVTRHAFDSARQGVLRGPNDEAILWRAHGTYHLKGLDDPLEIHEAGIAGIAPLSPPPDSEKAQRALAPDEEETLGWRPGVGLSIPGRRGWQLQRKLGAGGFGEAWLAVSKRTKERRAFKFCFQASRLRSLKRELTLFRLLKEALGERNDIARLYDVRLDEAPFFLEMEYTPDGSLDRWVRDPDRVRSMTLRDRARFVAEVAEALAAAHSVGVLHKDVKPSNVLVRRDQDGQPHARLTDFGIGQLLNRSVLEAAQVSITGFTETGALTDLGAQSGTRLYMAPELMAGRPASIASDIYAVGVFLYQFVVGDFSRPLAQGWESDITDPLVQEDIAGCVAGDPKGRPPSCEIVARSLRSLGARRRKQVEMVRRQARKEHRRRKRQALLQQQHATEIRRSRLLRVIAGIAALLFVVSISGLVMAGLLTTRRREADEARRRATDALAREQEATARTQHALQAEAEAKLQVQRALTDVLSLADATKIRDLLGEQDNLWPVHPASAPRMIDWLARAQELQINGAKHRESIKELRARALPYAEAQRQDDHSLSIDLRRQLEQQRRVNGVPLARFAELTARIDKIDELIKRRRSWQFANAQDGWKHQVLVELLAGLDRLKRAEPDIRLRCQRSRTLHERSVVANMWTWKSTIQAVATSPRYANLKLRPQIGLVPLGPDRTSGLHEFACIDTGRTPRRNPQTGRLVATDDVAIVLVLVPGGRFWMGAQKHDPFGPNYDQQAAAHERPVHKVTLGPFFLSKYECTWAQWRELTVGTTTVRDRGQKTDKSKPAELLPVAQISWDVCNRVLLRHNLTLPTEAQWEYACRAGTDTPWATGRLLGRLRGAANVADASCARAGRAPPEGYTGDIDDGFVTHAPIGSLAPNPLGIHDMHGNVWEWCRDSDAQYQPQAATNPCTQQSGERIVRGGSWYDAADRVRSSNRDAHGPSFRSSLVGVRPARVLDR